MADHPDTRLSVMERRVLNSARKHGGHYLGGYFTTEKRPITYYHQPRGPVNRLVLRGLIAVRERVLEMTCMGCWGKGQKPGFLGFKRKCRACSGSGKTFEDPQIGAHVEIVAVATKAGRGYRWPKGLGR